MNSICNITIALLSTVALCAASSAVVAGDTAGKMEKAGSVCFNAGPSNWVHCWRVKDFEQPAIPVMVFSEDGADYLGTELLIHKDIYRGQSCPQDGGSEWALNEAIGYYACHHFHTGHH